jgi:uncharacterized ferritin-like protein (DUF455 family)
MLPTQSIHHLAYVALCENCPSRKAEQVDALVQLANATQLSCDDDTAILRLDSAGRPAKPELVAPRELTRRSLNTPQGYAAMMHSLCHIEFNAINLALDAVYRFRGLPYDFYTDWLQVAAEEAYHFSILSQHLHSLGFAYGDFKGHNSLWELAVATDYDPLVRMALVPRVQEAHGLDVTPGLIARFKQSGMEAAVVILEIILRDEIGHVKIGNRWFNYLCEQRQLDPLTTFRELLAQVYRGRLHGPFALDIRREAGFTDAELDYFRQVG